MKNIRNAGYILVAAMLVACGKAPEPKNDFERAAYAEQRPSSDQKADEYRKPAKVLEFAQVAKGMSVGDLSAGGGYYTELLSHLVGKEGTVFYHNKPDWAEKEKNKQKIAERTQNNRLENVETVIADLNAYSFKKSADIIFLSKIYHDLYLKEDSEERKNSIAAFMTNLKKNLKPSGRVLVIDHSAAKGTAESSTGKTHRIDEEFVKGEFASHGFKFVSSTDILRNQSDDRTTNIWNSSQFPNTDRFVLLFELESK